MESLQCDAYLMEDLEYYATSASDEDDKLELDARQRRRHHLPFIINDHRRRCSHVYMYTLRSCPPYKSHGGYSRQQQCYYDEPAQRSFEHVDPREIARPSAPLFGRYDEDEDEADSDSEDDSLSGEGKDGSRYDHSEIVADDWFSNGRSLWIEDIPCIDDDEFEALLSASVTSYEEAHPRSNAEEEEEESLWDSESLRCEHEAEKSGVSEVDVPRGWNEERDGSHIDGELNKSFIDSEEEEDKEESRCQIVRFGKYYVRMGVIPARDDLDPSVWASAYEGILGEMGRSRVDFMVKPKTPLYDTRTVSSSQLQEGCSIREPALLPLRQAAVARSMVQRHTNRIKQPKLKDPLRVRLLSESILNRANKALGASSSLLDCSNNQKSQKRLNGCDLRVLESLYELDRL